MADDRLDSTISAMQFASGTILYVGTETGSVFRFTFDTASRRWTRTAIHALGGSQQLPTLWRAITDIAVDPADPSGASIYVTIGGHGDYRHVWHFDGAQWQHRSGGGSSTDSLLDVHASAIEVDPLNPTHLYVGTDIGVWRSRDGGLRWSPFSQGLPDAGVRDLLLHQIGRVIRAATHGRGIYEHTLDTDTASGIELYVRRTQWDTGRVRAVSGLPDPTAPGDRSWHWESPDVKVDTPNALRGFQLPATGTPGFIDFVDTLQDGTLGIATHATPNTISRVYVQVHNRGVITADNVRVTLLIALLGANLPALPVDYAASVRNGTPIRSAYWRTVGTVLINNVRVGHPALAAFDLPPTLTPPPANRNSNNHHALLALVHHPDDQHMQANTNANAAVLDERKMALKAASVVQFVGEDPEPPLVVPFTLNNSRPDRDLRLRLTTDLKDYPGRVQLVLPPIRTQGSLPQQLSGLAADTDKKPFADWAAGHLSLLQQNPRSVPSFDPDWTKQRIDDVNATLRAPLVLNVTNKRVATLRNVILGPSASITAWLVVSRSDPMWPGMGFDFDALSADEDAPSSSSVMGGMRVRVECVPEIEPKVYSIKLTATKRGAAYRLLTARLSDSAGRVITPADGAILILTIDGESRTPKTVEMRWLATSRHYYYYLATKPRTTSSWVDAYVRGRAVARTQYRGT